MKPPVLNRTATHGCDGHHIGLGSARMQKHVELLRTHARTCRTAVDSASILDWAPRTCKTLTVLTVSKLEEKYFHERIWDLSVDTTVLLEDRTAAEKFTAAAIRMVKVTLLHVRPGALPNEAQSLLRGRRLPPRHRRTAAPTDHAENQI